MKPKVAIVRGKFLNKYEMQFYEPLAKSYEITAYGSYKSYHNQFAFPVVALPSPMDLPEFPYKIPLLNRLFIDAHYLLGLEERLKGFDIVHTAETYFHYTQQCLNAKKRGFVRKVIATVLENIPFNNEGIWVRKAFKKRARDELDHIVALTLKTKEALIIEGCDPVKISVISHFIDTQRFKPDRQRQIEIRNKDLRKLNILFCGRLEKYKGVLDILEAARLLTSDKTLNNYEISFTLVGQGGLKKQLQKLIRKFHLENRVVILDVSYLQMPKIYQNAHIFMAPSKSTPTWQEQYSTVLLEAQSCGLPIVTTNSGGIPENISDAGLIAEEGNTKELVINLKKYITSPRLRSYYAQKARQRALTVHDIHIGAKKLDSLYQKLLHE